MKVVFSPAANDDLMEIALFIAQDNTKRALTFVDELEGNCLARDIGDDDFEESEVEI